MAYCSRRAVAPLACCSLVAAGLKGYECCCPSQCLLAGAGHVWLQSRDILGQSISRMQSPQYCLRDCACSQLACRCLQPLLGLVVGLVMGSCLACVSFAADYAAVWAAFYQPAARPTCLATKNELRHESCYSCYHVAGVHAFVCGGRCMQLEKGGHAVVGGLG